MSYTDTRADRPLTRRRYPPNNNTNTSSSNPSSSGALVPFPQPYPLVSSSNNNTTVEMDRYMAYMDLGQLLEHNMDTLFPAADDLLANHDVVTGENSTAYRNYLMEIEDAAVGLNNGTQIFAQIPSIDVRAHQQRSARGNSRILRNFVLMDGRSINETGGHSIRKPSTYQNNFPDFSNTGHVEDAFLFHFDTKSSTDPFTATTCHQSAVDDQGHLNTKWQEMIPRKYKLDEVFQEYKLKEAEEDSLHEEQRNFARELFFAAMFYVDEEEEGEDKDRIMQEDVNEDVQEIGKKKVMLKPHKKYW